MTRVVTHIVREKDEERAEEAADEILRARPRAVIERRVKGKVAGVTCHTPRRGLELARSKVWDDVADKHQAAFRAGDHVAMKMYSKQLEVIDEKLEVIREGNK